MEKIETLKFYKNWNNKLANDIFTTIRSASKHYYIGQIVNILCTELCTETPIKQAQIIDIQRCYLPNINNTILTLDTGVYRYEALEILTKYIPDRNAQILTLETVE